jgi:hypothetical protein
MIKMFVGSTYDVRHENINKDNCTKMLESDIRSRLIGDVNKFVYGGKSIILKSNNNIEYIGGFYYEQIPKSFISSNNCDYIVEAELRQIDASDLVVIILMNYSAIATITELMYASFNKKRTIIFCNPKITKFEVEGEYWFPINAALRTNKENINVVFVQDTDEIIDYINRIEE